jgi:hypothetical protein
MREANTSSHPMNRNQSPDEVSTPRPPHLMRVEHANHHDLVPPLPPGAAARTSFQCCCRQLAFSSEIQTQGAGADSPTMFIAQNMVPKIWYLNSWSSKVVLKWPSGGPGAGLFPAPGPPKGLLSTTSVPHEFRYPISSTLFCALKCARKPQEHHRRPMF